VPNVPNDPGPDLTDEEGVVLAVTIKHAPCSPEDVKRHVDRHYGSLVSLDVPQIERILRRLEALGLVTASHEPE
jgi:DNA-binding PadR family transcriptional regulator